MEQFNGLAKNPGFIMRCVISLFLIIGLLCFLFPFTTLSANAEKEMIVLLELFLGLFGKNMPNPRQLSGVQLIFAFAAEGTIHENLDIGPLPCNAYVTSAILLGIIAVVLLWLSWKRPFLSLLSSLASLASAILLILFRPRFTDYYTAYTKHGGEAFGNLLTDEYMVLSVEPALVIAIVCFFLAFMVTFMFHMNSKHDPFFRGV